MSYIDIVKTHETTAYALADTPLAENVKSIITVIDTETLEAEFTELLNRITDADLRDRIDAAAGRIAYAYERLGFIQGVVTDRAIINPS